jgi:DNA-binding MarR family transcriptional regulator
VPESEPRDHRDERPDPRQDSLEPLRDEGLVTTVTLDERDRAVVLTDRGRELLELHQRDLDNGRRDRFGGRVNRRELTHDASVYDAYRQASRDLGELLRLRRVRTALA